MAKHAILVIKKVILSHFADPDREARAREDGNQGNPDEVTSTNNRDQSDNPNWFQYEQDSVQVLFS